MRDRHDEDGISVNKCGGRSAVFEIDCYSR